jgi:hypothetical protein
VRVLLTSAGEHQRAGRMPVPVAIDDQTAIKVIDGTFEVISEEHREAVHSQRVGKRTGLRRTCARLRQHRECHPQASRPRRFISRRQAACGFRRESKEIELV